LKDGSHRWLDIVVVVSQVSVGANTRAVHWHDGLDIHILEGVDRKANVLARGGWEPEVETTHYGSHWLVSDHSAGLIDGVDNSCVSAAG
jgi:hypothetical protein